MDHANLIQKKQKKKDSSICRSDQTDCMMNSVTVSSDHAPKYNCEHQGIQAGWADVYDYKLDGQYIDITECAPGDYILRVTINPDGRFELQPSGKSVCEVAVTIPEDNE